MKGIPCDCKLYSVYILFPVLFGIPNLADFYLFLGFQSVRDCWFYTYNISQVLLNGVGGTKLRIIKLFSYG